MWRKVIASIEDALPLYDEVNEVVSMGRASEARYYAAQNIVNSNARLILDAGIGPGTMSSAILNRSADVDIVGLDYSVKLLSAGRLNLARDKNRTHFVRGCFEGLPFRSGVFDSTVTAFALRDSTDLGEAIGEIARSLRGGGRFVIVDLAKPDDLVKRLFASIYVNYIMPMIAKVRIWRRMKGNPWRTIAPTYANLPPDRKFRKMLETRFRPMEEAKYLAGGLAVIVLQPAPSPAVRTRPEKK